MSLKIRVKRILLDKLGGREIYQVYKIILKSFKDTKHQVKEYMDRTKAGKVKRQENAIEHNDEIKDLDVAKKYFEGFDRDHIWAFNSGNSGKDFRGNPKYFFAYINHYRPDIRAYWVCPDEEVVQLVRSLGFTAFLSGTPAAAYACEKTGVCVSEQVRGYVPFKNVKYLNLWHGMGYKVCERRRVSDDDDLKFHLCPKYINNNTIYLNQMLITVTCPMQEEQFLDDFGVTRDKFIRTGYARCTYQKKYQPIITYEHDLIKQKGLPDDTKMVVYAPTFRTKQGNTFLDAIHDLDKLHEVCEKNHLLFIFKMHPLMEKEAGFVNAINYYSEKPYFWFWKNKDDIYEIMDKIDLLIYDYSSIYSDFLSAGVKHYIRYVFDLQEMIDEGAFQSVEEYYERTSGRICGSFEEMLDALNGYEKEYDPAELKRIYDKQWAYEGEDDLEKTIQAVMDFKIDTKVYPTLYSYDIFDTLFSRKGLKPESIFYAVKDRMRSEDGFTQSFMERYPEIRHSAETTSRIYMARTQQQRNSIHVEITMDMIFDKIQEVYGITDQQRDLLMQWEIEEELNSVIPLQERIDEVKRLKQNGEEVILISDMYLPKTVILEMLKKADPILAELPFFLSNEYGVLKTSRLLFFEVYRSVKPFYNYGKWIHTGDNLKADCQQPRRMGIKPRLIEAPAFNEIEEDLAKYLDNYDGYKLSAMAARLRNRFCASKSEFVIDFIAPLMVSYVDWALRDALEKGFTTLYFVARDGHPLKRIADALIEEHGWSLSTKYIYASRRVWRVPSYIEDIDEDFWANYGGNFLQIASKSKFLRAMDIDDEEVFHSLFPGIDLDQIDFADWTNGQPAKQLVPVLKSNQKYREYLLKRAEEQRVLSAGYLEQEISKDEKIAFVEFYGRGYNQLCHSRLWNYVLGKEVPTYYYYAKCIQPSEGNCVRYNMTLSENDLFFMEAVFANMPYHSIDKYEMVDGKIVPVIEEITHDKDLFEAMQDILPVYARQYAALEFKNPFEMNKAVFDFTVNYYFENTDKPFIYNNFGDLVDAISMYAEKLPFARPYTMEDIEGFREDVGRRKGTHSVMISYMRSMPDVKAAYDEIFQIYEDEKPDQGRKLDETQIMYNMRHKEKYDALRKRLENIKALYSEACKMHEIEDLILVIVDDKGLDSDMVYSLKKQLNLQSKYQVKYVAARKIADDELVTLSARARMIIMAGNPQQLAGVEFRTGTNSVLIHSSSFSLNKHGNLIRPKLFWKQKMNAIEMSQKVDCVEIPGEKQKDLILATRGIRSSAAASVHGSCLTDLYFDDEYIKSAKKNLYQSVPAAKDKKIIYLMLENRIRDKMTNWLEMPDLERMKEVLGNEYYVVVDTRVNEKIVGSCKNRLTIPGFSCKVPAGISVRSMICAADAIVGDFRDEFFEVALTDKKAYFWDADIETRMKNLNVIYDYYKISPFEGINSTEDLIDRLKSDVDDNAQKKSDFVQQFMGYCDGHTAERIVNQILAE